MLRKLLIWPRFVLLSMRFLRAFLLGREGRRFFRVTPAEADEVRQRTEVELGPEVEVVAVGADLETLRRQSLLPFLGERGYDPALVRFSINRVIAWYQGEGYYNVAVETEEDDGVEF